jgi:acyl dehydratase
MTGFFEDLVVGERIDIGTHVFTAAEIKTFAREFDPQSFHVDEEAARSSHFGALCASGWQTAAIGMRLMVDYRTRKVEEAHSRGDAVGAFGPASGFRDLQWRKPVFAGDAISYAIEVTDKRASRSRPERGLFDLRFTATNQHGEQVFSVICTAFIGRRDAGSV